MSMREKISAVLDDWHGARCDRDLIASDIVAALPECIKPLEWVVKWETYYAHDFAYVVKQKQSGWCASFANRPIREPGGRTVWCETPDAAKDVANYHHRSQIMSAFGVEVEL